MDNNCFRCDRCGQIVDFRSTVLMFWTENGSTVGQNFQLICHNCDGKIAEQESSGMFNDKSSSTIYLTKFPAYDEALTLLQMIDEKEVKQVEEVTEILRRLVIPGYEQVRPFLSQAICENLLDSKKNIGMGDIQNILKAISEGKLEQ